MTESAVSVVIPTRDRPRQVWEAVRSALAQDRPALDIWIVDDGSVTPVEPPSDLAAGPRLGVIRLPRPGGAGEARNVGAARGAGDLIAFLDDDDRWRPDLLACLVARLQAAGDDVALAYGGYELWGGGRVILRHLPDPTQDLRWRLLEHPCIAPSTVLLRRRAFEAVGGFDPTLERSEDWDLWLRLTDRWRIVAVPRVLADRALHEEAPSLRLRAYTAFVARLAPRIATLPTAHRRQVEARHLFNTGVLLAQIGHRAEARATLWDAWRHDRRSLRPILHLGRTVVAERNWAWAAGIAHRLRITR